MEQKISNGGNRREDLILTENETSWRYGSVRVCRERDVCAACFVNGPFEERDGAGSEWYIIAAQGYVKETRE